MLFNSGNTPKNYLNKSTYFSKYSGLNSKKFKKIINIGDNEYGIGDYFLNKKYVTSGATRNSYKLKSTFPIQLKFKHFFFSKKSYRGRSKKGSILCRTKGKLSFYQNYPYICKSFRLKSLSIITNIFIVSFKAKLLSQVISSSGVVLYVRSGYTHVLFKVSKLYGVFTESYLKNFVYLSNFIKIPQIFFLIYQLPKYKPVSMLEIMPGKGYQYVLSTASKATINKVDLKLNLTLIKLPSGVHKVFSIYSSGYLGSVPFYKKLNNPANAGFNKNSGKKSITRGVAKNPVDHPHGGRAKSIKYQRTPWGKTTKFK